MNFHDDPSLDAFASELRREFSPTPPSPDLARAVAAALVSPARPKAPAAPPILAFLQNHAWLSWTSFAAAAVLAAALLLANGWGVRPGSAAATRAKQRDAGRDPSSSETAVAVSPSPGAEAFPRSAPRGATLMPARGSEPATSSRDFYRPVVVRDRRDFVDTLRWRERRTGAVLEVSYPRSEFRLVPAEPM